MIRPSAGIAEIVEDVQAAVDFYRNKLGLEVEHEPDSGYATVKISGVLHFGIWGKEQAAQTIYGENGDPAQVPLGFTVGFEVDVVEADTKVAEGKGLTFIQSPRTESWGQATSRFLSPSGAVCEFSETPWARKILILNEAEVEKAKE